MKKFLAFFVIFFLFFIFINACKQGKNKINFGELINYPDVLDISNIPDSANNYNANAFFDKGSWFGFALPDSINNGYAGAFIGPYSVAHAKWISNSILKWRFKNYETNEIINLANADSISIHFYPGMLTQFYRVKNIDFVFTLWYANNSLVINNLKIINNSKESLKILPENIGNLFNNISFLETGNNFLSFKFQKAETNFNVIIFFPAYTKISLNSGKTGYKTEYDNPIEIKGRSSNSVSIGYVFDSKSQEIGKSLVEYTNIINNYDSTFQENLNRWNNYLNKLFTKETVFTQKKEYRDVVVKSLITLINNWKAGLGKMKFDGVFPSYSTGYFSGIWAWDSWKHAVALSRFDIELAKMQIKSMFELQDTSGMINDCLVLDDTKNNNEWIINTLDTKPPLAAWAVLEVFKKSGDTSFITEIYPKLLKYHKWWYNNRDHDRDSLCEYGSTEEKIYAARWESGMDDGLRFDNSYILKNSERAFSLGQESCDLNSYLYFEKNCLAELALAINKINEQNTFLKEAVALKYKINKLMYDKVTGFYYDIDYKSHNFIKIKGPEGWVPLWAKLADVEKAKTVISSMKDTAEFLTYIPFPTIPANHKAYMSGYWRGPVWLDQAHFGIISLQNYNESDLAQKITIQLITRCEGLFKSDKPIRENYDPRNGKGMKAKNFSWSAAHIILMLTE